MYLGYVRAGVWGATAVGIAFIAPSFLMVVAISALYVRYDGLKWMQALFYGIGAAVIGIILRSTLKLGRATLKKDPLLWAIFFVLAISTAYTGREIIWLFLLAGLVCLPLKHGPHGLGRLCLRFRLRRSYLQYRLANTGPCFSTS
jgi:chromate transporter